MQYHHRILLRAHQAFDFPGTSPALRREKGKVWRVFILPERTSPVETEGNLTFDMVVAIFSSDIGAEHGSHSC